MKASQIAVFGSVALLLAAVSSGCAADEAASDDPIRAALTETMEIDDWPAALVAVRHGQDSIRTYAEGVAELGSDTKASADSQIRIGSNTKTFTAVIVLQLVAEGRIDLDLPVETYLPGVVSHAEVSGGDITVRQILQHTSGLPDMSDEIGANLIEWQHRYIAPRASLDLALKNAVTGSPGAGFHYSNSNYIVAGLLIEAVSGRPLAEEIDKRILVPLGLTDTYFPDQGEQVIRGGHPNSYIPVSDPPVDYTDFDPSWGFAAGAMVSTTADLTTFFSALAVGELVPAEQLAQMQDTVPAAGADVPAEGALWEGAAYGLGLIAFELSCGAVAWGHGGDVPGTVSRAAATDDGRAAAVVVTQNATSADGEARLRTLMDTAICSSD